MTNWLRGYTEPPSPERASPTHTKISKFSGLPWSLASQGMGHDGVGMPVPQAVLGLEPIHDFHVLHALALRNQLQPVFDGLAVFRLDRRFTHTANGRTIWATFAHISWSTAWAHWPSKTLAWS